MNEIRILRRKVDKLENIVEARRVGEARPDKYEKRTVAEFERKRKEGRQIAIRAPFTSREKISSWFMGS